MLIGMVATFASIATLAAVGGSWAVHVNEAGRAVALALLALFSVTLLSRRAAAVLTAPVVRLGSDLSDRAGRQAAGAAGSSLLLGMATGLLWAPCAGPILGLVLTGAALRGADVETTLLLATYAAGAATSLAVAALAGGSVLAAMKRWLGVGERLRQGLGLAMLAALAAVALGSDTGLLARLSFATTTKLEQALVDGLGGATASTGAVQDADAARSADATPGRYRSRLPVEGRFPSLDGAVQWLNGGPQTVYQLRGKVVLVHFWTYSCINCIRTIPFVRAWAETYRDKGLVVIGVHAPEFAFERNLDNVSSAIQKFSLSYPVAVDNDFRLWRAFRNSYWPALYFIDAEGRVRHHHFGEGEYARSERVIQDLLAEAAGHRNADARLTAPGAHGAELAPDLRRLRSGETYLGHAKAENFVSPEGVEPDAARDYTSGQPRLNEWSLAGNWTVLPEQAGLNRAGGAITYRFRARDLHLVLGPGPAGRPVRFVVTLDGEAPGADHGADVDRSGHGVVSEARLYQLVRQTGDVGERTFAIRFLDPGVEAFAFTFG